MLIEFGTIKTTLTALLHTCTRGTFGSAEDFKIENAEGELTYLKGDFAPFAYIKAGGTGF